jgi:hypothetical protein
MAVVPQYSMFTISLTISLTILFLTGMSRFIDEHVKKLRLLLKFAMRVLSQLLSDLLAYYASRHHNKAVVHRCSTWRDGQREADGAKTLII